jgi:hypothetical protein
MLGTPTDADDVVQEAFVRRQSVDRTAIQNPQAWLLTVTTHLALDRLYTSDGGGSSWRLASRSSVASESRDCCSTCTQSIGNRAPFGGSTSAVLRG